jgi:hypothetical protein
MKEQRWLIALGVTAFWISKATGASRRKTSAAVEFVAKANVPRLE